MKLLLDQNLSRRVAAEIASVFPGSAHVVDLGLVGAADTEIWQFALDNGYAVATKDSDFRQLALTRGSPPKAILLLIGNCSTDDAARTILLNAARIRAFGDERDTALLIVTR